MIINITRDVSLSKAKRICSKCRSIIPPKTYHLRTTTYHRDDYPVRKNWCRSCSRKYLDSLAVTIDNMSVAIRENQPPTALKVDPIVFGEFL